MEAQSHGVVCAYCMKEKKDRYIYIRYLTGSLRVDALKASLFMFETQVSLEDGMASTKGRVMRLAKQLGPLGTFLENNTAQENVCWWEYEQHSEGEGGNRAYTQFFLIATG